MKKKGEEIARALIQLLWDEYVLRVPYAKTYAGLVEKQGGKLVFDHLAFRTIKAHTGEQPGGISAISHIFKNLGYKKAGEYIFRKKKLSAIHLEHPALGLPRIFISQLETEQLPGWAQQAINQTVKDTPYLISTQGIQLCNRLKNDGFLTNEAAEVLVNQLAVYFQCPWKIPLKQEVLKLNDISQYAAWTILHGNSVTHFAVSVSRQDVKAWPDLETTCQAMVAEGIPMKSTIEGERGSLLQQSATLAIKEHVQVKSEDGIEKIPWTYAYFEFTQRNPGKDTGKVFSGFLDSQARHLFDMTLTHEN